MAELLVPPGFVNCSWRFTLNNVKVMSFALAWAISAPVDSDVEAQLASAAMTTNTTGWGVNDIFDQWTFLGCHLRQGNDGPPLVGDFETSAAGTASGHHSPPSNVSVIVKKSTGFGGRAFRGRSYLPCFALDEGSVGDTGIIASTPRSDLQTAWDRFTTKLGTTLTSFDGFVLLHSDVDVVPTPITSMGVEAMVATQRRRLR